MILMNITRGCLVRHKVTEEVGVIVDIKVWKQDGYKLKGRLSDKIFSSRKFPAIMNNKASNSIDFFVHWASGTTSWIISSGVLLLEEASI
jgi:hypothetical protein